MSTSEQEDSEEVMPNGVHPGKRRLKVLVYEKDPVHVIPLRESVMAALQAFEQAHLSPGKFASRDVLYEHVDPEILRELQRLLVPRG